jgi:hypothetical protein
MGPKIHQQLVWPTYLERRILADMKLVYRLEIEIPNDALATDVGRVIQEAWSWLRLRGWKVRLTPQIGQDAQDRKSSHRQLDSRMGARL